MFAHNDLALAFGSSRQHLGHGVFARFLDVLFVLVAQRLQAVGDAIEQVVHASEVWLSVILVGALTIKLVGIEQDLKLGTERLLVLPNECRLARLFELESVTTPTSAHLFARVVIQIQVDPIRLLLQPVLGLFHVIANRVGLNIRRRLVLVVRARISDKLLVKLGAVHVEVLAGRVALVQPKRDFASARA